MIIKYEEIGMIKRFTAYWKLFYYILLGHLLLLTSAVYENGSTDFSKKLVPDMSLVPEMIESLLASITVLVIWAYLYCYITEKHKN